MPSILDLKQQLQELGDLEHYEIKIGTGSDFVYLPAALLLSDSLPPEYIAALEETSQSPLVDRRSIDDDFQLTRLIRDAAFAENDSDINQLYRSLVYLPARAWPAATFTDRSGIFLPGSDITIPVDTHTDKSYAQILDETAQSYADLNPVVMWSGGVDSTAILAALVKNNIDFTVALDRNSQAESPELYDYVLANFDCLPLNNHSFGLLDVFHMIKQPVSHRTVITGDCNDQIFPIPQHHLVQGKMFFKHHVERVGTDNINDFYRQPVGDHIKYMNSRDYFSENHSKIHGCSLAHSQQFFDTVLAPKLPLMPWATEYAYQLVSGFRFIFKYQMHLEKLINMTLTNTLNNTFKAFYNTADFQRWSITNFEHNYETESTSYLTMKTGVKQYSYDVFKINEILQQHKRGSSPIPQHLNLPDSIINSIDNTD